MSKELQAETEAQQGTNADVTSVCPTCTKPNVVCSQSNVNLDIVSDVCNELSPILDELNNILSRYNLTKKEVSFHWTDNKITAFISCG